MEIIAVIITIIVGYLGSALLGNAMNWPDAGAIVAIAVMGFFILRKLDKNGKDNQPDK